MTDLLGSTTSATNTPMQAGGGTFPGAGTSTSMQGELTTVAQQLAGMTPAKFAADYGITSTELNTYIDPTTGQLNVNAVYLAYYYSLNQAGRQAIQSEMSTAGLIKPTDANGTNNKTATSAFKELIGTSAAQGTNPLDYLNILPINGVQNSISSNLTQAQKNASMPVTVTESNPNTLAADITNAFDQALGYSPDQSQIDSFIKQIQGQETTYGEAPRTQAQAQITQAHEEQSALNALGSDGVDTVIQAYQHAINGTKMPGAGTVQGPVNGAQPLPTFGMPAPGSPVKPGDSYRFDQSGNEVGANVLPTPSQTQSPTQRGVLGTLGYDFANNLNPLTTSAPPTTKTETHYRNFNQGTVPYAPAGTPNSVPTHGGLYALSPADWQKIQTLYPIAKKYATPGQAPQSIQLAGFTSLLSDTYDSNGHSWSKAIAAIASGSPFGSSEGTHLSQFGNQVASEVNNQISSLQNQVNNDSVTVKVAAPDANAEAAAAAKQSDPVGYYAANDASWGQELNQMLAGAPLMYQQGTSDTFSGPVSTAIAGTMEGK